MPTRRTIFLDVVDPGMPEEAQLALHARLDELKAFDELRPPLWKRVCFKLGLMVEPVACYIGADRCEGLAVVGAVCDVGVACVPCLP